jgi:hypothetical protein
MPATAVDRLQGLTTSVAVKPPCVAVTTFDTPLTGLYTVGTIALEEGDRVLVRAQTDASKNGIYNASTSDWTRALDFDGARDVVCGTLVLVRNAIAQGAIYEVTSQDPVIIDDSQINFDLRDNPTVFYTQTQAEIDVGAVPVNLFYPVGHVYRYGTNTNPGVTDMTVAISTAANVCRHGNYVLQLPADILLASNSLDFSNITVKGLGGVWGGSGYIKRSSGSTFDIVTSTGGTILQDMRVDGGNPSSTAGLTGDNISFKATSPAHPYLNTLINVSSTNARARCCYIERGGYTSFFHVQFLAAGLHALECYAAGVGDECTTVRDYGSSQFGSCPNGFGVKLTECTSMAFHDSIIEGTWGIQINGGDNRALNFDGVYEENTQITVFTGQIVGTTLTVLSIVSGPPLTLGCGLSSGVAANTVITAYGTGGGGTGTYTVSVSQSAGPGTMNGSAMFINDNSGGIGFTVRGCFGGNTQMPPLNNWQNVYYQGNSNLSEGPIPSAGRIQTHSGGQNTLSATGDVTTAQLSLAPGTYRLWGVVQTIISSGGGSATQLACQITTNVAASGLSNSVSSLVEGAAQTQSFGASQDARVNAFTEVQVFSTTTYYLRAHIALTGTITEAYNGQLRAELIE